MMPTEFVRLLNGKRTGKGAWTAKCPAHNDRNASLSIKEGRKAILVTCWSQGCPAEAIVEAMGLKMADLWYQSQEKLDPKKLAEARRKQEAEETRERNLRIGEWVLRFLDSGYTAEDREDDMELACAAACALVSGAKPHWEETIRIAFERMAAANYMLEHKMLGRIVAKPRW